MLELINRKTAVLMALSIIGFGLLQGARLIDPNSGPYSDSAFALYGLFVDGITFLVVAVLSYVQIIERPEPLFVLGAFSMAVYLALDALHVDSVPLQLLMQTAAGMGWSLNILCWMPVFVAYRPRFSLVMIAAGFLVDAVLASLVTEFGVRSNLLLAGVLALSIGMLFICIKQRPYLEQRMKEHIVPETTLSEAFAKTRRTIASTFVISLVCGFAIESDRILTGLDYAQTGLTSLICIGAALLMMFLLVALKVKKANIDYICPLATLCLAVVFLLRSLGVGGSYAAGSIMTSTLITFYVVLWLMFISEAYERTLPGFFLLGLALGVARLSVDLGRLVSRWLAGTFGLQADMVIACCLALLAIAMSLIFLSYMHFASRQRDAQQDGADAESAEQGDAPQASHADAAFDLLVSTYGLSSRESELVREYAHGRSARYIADWYMISEYTVKTHLQRAYAKIGVHSRQELLDAIDEMESRLLKS